MLTTGSADLMLDLLVAAMVPYCLLVLLLRALCPLSAPQLALPGRLTRRHPPARRRRSNVSEIRRLILEDDAQTTAEYALVILGGAAVASALIAWAAKGDAIKSFFTKIFDKLKGSF
jgi:Flp pilus assembly pilin Flp